jgi:hypothetical protein
VSQYAIRRSKYWTHNPLATGCFWRCHAFVIVTLATLGEDAETAQATSGLIRSSDRLVASGERRQYFNLYGMSQLLLKIFLVSRAAINQYRTHLDDAVEVRTRPLLTRNLEGLSDRLSLDHLLGYACCSACASPVMEGNGHHCVTLKHAFRPYRGGLKASTGIESLTRDCKRRDTRAVTINLVRRPQWPPCCC